MQINGMQNIQIVQLSSSRFNENSLDDFVLKQRVANCWRKIGGSYVLVPVCYTEEWNLYERKKMAQKIISTLDGGAAVFAAIKDDSIIGFALLSSVLFGSSKQYVDLEEFYVSEPYRRHGIGKILFEKVCLEATRLGAKKLYISAHSAQESIAAYKKYGCVLAEEPDAAHIVKEPFDLQLQYDLQFNILK